MFQFIETSLSNEIIFTLFSGSSSGGYASDIQGIGNQRQQQIPPQYSKFSFLPHLHTSRRICGLTEQSGFTSVLISIFTSLVSIFLINGTHIAILQFLLLEMKVAFKEAILVSREVRFYFHLCFNLSRQVYLMRYTLFSGSSSSGYASGIQGIGSQHQQQISPQYSKFSFLPHLHSSRQICDLTIRFYYSSYFSFYLLD